MRNSIPVPKPHRGMSEHGIEFTTNDTKRVTGTSYRLTERHRTGLWIEQEKQREVFYPPLKNKKCKHKK